MKINFSNTLVIIVSSFLIAFVYNELSPNGLDLIRKEIIVKNASVVDIGSESNENNLELLGINYAQAYEVWVNNKATFIDARDQWDFEEGHIPNSINIPEFSFEPDDPKVQQLNRDKTYIVYCDGDDCDVSKRLGVQLLKMGFKHVYVYLGGYYEWQKNNMEYEGDQ